MSFLRSVIADARPRKPALESLSSPSAFSRASSHPADGDVFQSAPAAGMREDMSPITNRLSREAASRRPHRPGETSSVYGPFAPGPTQHSTPAAGMTEDMSSITNRLSRDAASRRPHRSGETPSVYGPFAPGPTQHEEVTGSLAKSQNEADMVYDTASGIHQGIDTGMALSVNSPNGEGGNLLGHETVLSLNELTWPNEDPLPPTDSKQEKSLPISSHHKRGRESTFTPEPIEISADEEWEGPEKEAEHAGTVVRTEPASAALRQREEKADLVVEQEVKDHARANGGQPSGRPSETADKATMSPNAIEEPDTKDGYENAAESSGNLLSAPAEFPQQTDSPQTISNRHYSAPMPSERYRPGPVEKTVHQARRPLHKSTDTTQVPVEEVTQSLYPQGKAVAGNSSDRKATAVSDNTVNDILSHNIDFGSLSQPSGAKAGQEKAFGRVAAQVQPASVQSSVMPRNPISYNPVRHTAKTADGKSVDAPKVPEVKIGQVDVIIEAPHRSHNRRPSSSPASLSLASRHYLRRL